MVTEPEMSTGWREDGQDQKVERLERNKELLIQLWAEKWKNEIAPWTTNCNPHIVKHGKVNATFLQDSLYKAEADNILLLMVMYFRSSGR